MSLDDALDDLVKKSQKEKAKTQAKIEQQDKAMEPELDTVKKNLA
jgi:hypothetical protein